VRTGTSPVAAAAGEVPGRVGLLRAFATSISRSSARPSTSWWRGRRASRRRGRAPALRWPLRIARQSRRAPGAAMQATAMLNRSPLTARQALGPLASAPPSHHLTGADLRCSESFGVPRATRATNRSPSACPLGRRAAPAWCAVDNDLIEFEAVSSVAAKLDMGASAQPECDSSIAPPRAPASGRPTASGPPERRTGPDPSRSARTRCESAAGLLVGRCSSSPSRTRCRSCAPRPARSVQTSGELVEAGGTVEGLSHQETPLSDCRSTGSPGRANNAQPSRYRVFECPAMSLHSCEAPSYWLAYC